MTFARRCGKRPVMNRRRVVVTGLGVVAPLGFTEAEVWSGILEARSAIKPITAFDTAPFKVKHGAAVDGARLTQALQALQLPRQDRTVELALVAGEAALAAAGYEKRNSDTGPLPASVIFGTGIGLIDTLFNCCRDYEVKGLRGLRPTSIPRCMANAISAQLSLRFALTGTNYVITCACTSATTAIGTAFRQIRDGYADQVLCGGSEAPFERCLFGAWNNLGVMSALEPSDSACRPFDATRAGCVLGEGAGALFLESLDSAQSRGVRIRGEIIGFGESSDATHITSPSMEGQSMAITRALADAAITPTDVDYINAHGTATKANDETEAASILNVFGPETRRISVGSTKSMVGHLLGASGAVETLVTLLALESGKIPPNRNLQQPDPACSLHFAGSTPEQAGLRHAVKNSFGFGGTNGVLVLKPWKE